MILYSHGTCNSGETVCGLRASRAMMRISVGGPCLPTTMPVSGRVNRALFMVSLSSSNRSSLNVHCERHRQFCSRPSKSQRLFISLDTDHQWSSYVTVSELPSTRLVTQQYWSVISIIRILIVAIATLVTRSRQFW